MSSTVQASEQAKARLRPLPAVRIAWAATAALSSLLAVAAVYGAVAMRLGRYHAFWSPDSGALFASINAWIQTGSPVTLPYEYSASDPNAILHPLQGGYVINTPHGLSTVYGTAYPMLAGPFFRAFGFPGLLVPSIIAGLAACLAVMGTTRALGLRSWPLTAVAFGLCTPIAVYSVVFWHHAVTIAVTAAFMSLSVKSWISGGRRSAIGAGAVLGAGIFVHELAIVVFVAAMAAFAPMYRCPKARRLAGGLALGFIAVLMLWLAHNLLLYGSIVGSHLSGSNSLGSPVYRPHILDLFAIQERASVQLFGFHPPGADLGKMALYALAAAGVAALAYALDSKPLRRVALCAVGLLAYSAVNSWPKETTENGLFQTTPLFGLALCVPWLVRRTSTDERAQILAWMSRLCWVFCAAVFLNPIPPLMGWGSRFLLTVSPMLFVLSVSTVESMWRDARRGGELVLVAGSACLLVLGAQAQMRGGRAVEADLFYSQQLCAAARSLDAMIVTDTIWIPAELQAAQLTHPIFLVGDSIYAPRDKARCRRTFATLIGKVQPARFAYLGDGKGLSPLRATLKATSYVASPRGNRCGLTLVWFTRRNLAAHASISR